MKICRRRIREGGLSMLQEVAREYSIDVGGPPLFLSGDDKFLARGAIAAMERS